MLRAGYRYKTLDGHSIKYVDILDRDDSGRYEFKAMLGDSTDVTWYDRTGFPIRDFGPRLDIESGKRIPLPCQCNKGSFQYHLKFCPSWENPMTEGLDK